MRTLNKGQQAVAAKVQQAAVPEGLLVEVHLQMEKEEQLLQQSHHTQQEWMKV